MSTLFRALCMGAIAWALAPHIATAAPGEDPVVIQGRVSYLQLPTAPAAKSGSIQYNKGLPDEANAKISRYTAKAFSANIGDIKTEKDVVQSVQTKGSQTNCYQSIGSVSAPNKLGNHEQVVVLRGDVINICN